MKCFSSVLYVHGTEPDAACALARAVALARANQARLTALAVVEELPADTRWMGWR
jgi:hypothetical protein